MNRKLAYLSGAPRVSTRPEASASGPRTHVIGVMRAFVALGWEVAPYIVGDLVPATWVEGQDSLEALGRSWLRRLAADGYRVGSSLAHGRRAARRIGDVDWAYERFGSFQFLGWWFQRRGIPWILETNGIFFVEAARDRKTVALARLARALELWAYQKCDAMICPTPTVADLAIAEARVPKTKIVVVPNAVDTAHINPDGHSPTRYFEGSTVGYVGALIAWQALDLLIESLAELRQEGIDFNLVVVGEGPMRTEWEGLARSLGQEAHVRFIGQIPWADVPACLLGFDLGFSGQVPLAIGEMYHSPLKLYEYMAAARPVVASAFADSRQALEEGRTGYLFQPGSKEDLKRAMRAAFADRQRWPEMGMRARKVAMERHSWVQRVETMIHQVEPILQEKLGTPYPARQGR